VFVQRPTVLCSILFEFLYNTPTQRTSKRKETQRLSFFPGWPRRFLVERVWPRPTAFNRIKRLHICAHTLQYVQPCCRWLTRPLYLPDRPSGVPTIVMAHGFSTVKEMYLDKFAEVFAN
jgi:hypothetical protein